MSVISLDQETETARGWLFHARVTSSDGAVTAHAMRMSWADYDHWSHGAAAPAKVAEAVLRYVVDQGETAPTDFDASTIRRRHPDMDEVIGRYF